MTGGVNYYQIGYSVAPKIFLFNTGYYKNSNDINPLTGKENSGDVTRTETSYLIDGCVGYLMRKNNNQFAILVGGGGGKANSSYKKDLLHNYTADLMAHKTSAFCQPTFSILIERYASLSISAKVSYVNFNSISSHVTPGDVADIYPEDLSFLYKRNVSFFFAEPGITLRSGSERVKFLAQFIAPIKLNGTDLRYKKTRISLGISLNLF